MKRGTDNDKKVPIRKSRSYWIDIKIAKEFRKVSRKMGRKTCDMIEAFQKAIIEASEKEDFPDSLCNLKPVIIDIKNLEITSMYAKQGRKTNSTRESGIYCNKTRKRVSSRYCQVFCMYGGNYGNSRKETCDTYLKLF